MIGDVSPRLREHFDWPLFVSAMLIAALGVVNLYSATSVYTGPIAERYISQLYWIFAGGVIGGLIVALDYRHLERFGYVIYAFGVFCLVLVFVLARDVRGSARWIEFGSFRFQPSEFTKVCLTIALAKFLHDDPKSEPRQLRDFLIPAILAGVPALLILRQPDLGTAVTHLLIFLTMMAICRIRVRSLIVFVLGVIGGTKFMWDYVMRDYQKARIEVFLNPEADILKRGWHAYQSKVAIGDGGLLGHGFLKGPQNQFHFLPDQSTDFPFPVFAEEWGFIGSLVLVGLYGFLSLWSVRIASLAKDRFGAALAIGSGAVIFWQALINMGMVSGLLPVVGVTLPLFSYGGSSVTTVMLSIALLMSVSIRRHAPVPDRL